MLRWSADFCCYCGGVFFFFNVLEGMLKMGKKRKKKNMGKRKKRR